MALPVLAQIGIPVLVKGLAEGLSQSSSPVAKGAAAALNELGDAFDTGAVSGEELAEINRHLEKIREIEANEQTNFVTQVNESLRAEIASNDLYVRRMRPTFGYIIAVTWGAQMLSLAYIIVADTANASMVINAMSDLGAIWAVGLSVLGIYVYKRSGEKTFMRKAGSQDQVAAEKKAAAPAVPRKYNE